MALGEEVGQNPEDNSTDANWPSPTRYYAHLDAGVVNAAGMETIGAASERAPSSEPFVTETFDDNLVTTVDLEHEILSTKASMTISRDAAYKSIFGDSELV